ncbi:MAG TPA: hypothetical protein VH021_03270, partial [Trebonia sp.]|nr:hypothetical protein [Trebonia sp.]
VLRAEGQAQAISQVFQAIHTNDPDPKMLAYQYLQTLPQIAAGPGNTFWVIPGEVTSALKAVTSAFTGDAASVEGFPSSPVRQQRADGASPAAAMDSGGADAAAAALAAAPSAAAAALAALAPMAIPPQQEPAHDEAPGVVATADIAAADAPTTNGTTPNGAGPKTA